ncbi:AMP-binding protein [Haloplanus sp.]|uniref:AMP-binding protein n=1 Tax=Haloplanus sp. TaxID=1961696 RepID=UPI00260E9BE7|nr:AMP-binding protein [Haloplanus sp.]
MSTLADPIARDKRSDRPALRIVDRDRTHTYRDFCTTAWKAGHALRHLGVHEGSRVAVTPDPAPQVVWTLFGAASLGALLTFDVTADARVVVVPADREAEADDGRSVVAYGGAPTAATTTHWEKVVWSENPAMPPTTPSSSDPVLDADARSYTHGDLYNGAEAIVDDAFLDAETSVALRAPLADPRAVVAGVIAPLLAGGTVVVPDGAEEPVADVAVGDGPVPEQRQVGLDAVTR